MDLVMEMTKKTPKVLFESDKGYFLLQGSLTPEKKSKFFEKIFKYAEIYFMNPFSRTHLEIELDYFDTLSSWKLHEFISMFDDNQTELTNVTIIWKYKEQDFDMEDAGDEFAAMFCDLNFEIQLVEIPELAY